MRPRPYIIGETAYNHEGDYRYLIKMINDISEIGLNAVKFHLLLKADSYMQKDHPLIETIRQWMFNEKEWLNILNYSKKLNLDIVALCDDVESLEFINANFSEIFAIELHASGLNDHYLLEEAAKFSGKVILGVGGSTLDEIHYAVDFLRSRNKADILLMYGFQSYPTDYSDINLQKMDKIGKLFDLEIGYADHTAYNDPRNTIISCMAGMMGYGILEKHYTPDHGKERIDFHSAVGKEQMVEIKELLSLVLNIYGDGSMKMSDAELNYGNTGPLKKAIVAKHNIRKGDVLTLDNLCFKRTEGSTQIKQNAFIQLLGLKTNCDIDEDEIVDFRKVDYKFVKRSLKDFTHKEKQ